MKAKCQVNSFNSKVFINLGINKDKENDMKIAIIGFALSGFTFLKTILDNNKNKDLKIDIFEKRKEYPVGLAYETDTLDKLLNVNNNEMIYPPEDRFDFTKWMEKNNRFLDPVEKMAPRVYLGEYFKEQAEPYIRNPKVKIINEEALDIDVKISNKNELYIVGSENYEGEYDLVYLATGATFYQDPYGLRGIKNYIPKPYPLSQNYEAIKDDDRLAILGTSASSTDVFRYLTKNKNLNKTIEFFTGPNEYKIVDIPFEGDIYEYYSPNQAWIDKELSENGEISKEKLINTIEADFKKAGYKIDYAYKTYKSHNLELSREAIEKNDQALAFTEDYFIQFALFVADLVNYMNPIDRADFVENYYPYLSFLGGKTPYGSMKMLLKAHDDGKIDIITNAKKIKKNDDGSFTLTGDKVRKVDVIINATGFEMELEKVAEKIPLFNSLVKNEMVMADQNGNCIAATWPRLNPLSKKYGALKNLYVTGMMVSQTDLDNNDARCIQKTAMTIAEIILEENGL